MFYFTCCVCSIKDYTASTTELLTPQSVSTSSIADGLFRIILSRPMGPISPFPANEISDSMTRLICGGLMWRWILGFFANLRELAKRNLRCFFHGAHKLWMLENFATFTKPQKILRMKNCEGGFLFLEFFVCSCRAYLSVKLYRGIYMDMLGMLSAFIDFGPPRFVRRVFFGRTLWVDEILGVGIGWIRSLRCFPIDVDAQLWISNKFCIAVSEHPVIWLSKNAKRGAILQPLSQKIRGIPQTGSFVDHCWYIYISQPSIFQSDPINHPHPSIMVSQPTPM